MVASNRDEFKRQFVTTGLNRPLMVVYHGSGDDDGQLYDDDDNSNGIAVGLTRMSQGEAQMLIAFRQARD
jgi:hypothetical protein